MARKKQRERREERINLDTLEANDRRNYFGDLLIDEVLREERLGKLARGKLGTRKEYKI